jgi:hypothetical protein
LPKAVRLGGALELRAGIGDRDEAMGSFRRATRSRARSKKCCFMMFGSSVVPDLLETMNSVRSGSIASSTAFTCAGTVESRTSIAGNFSAEPKLLASTSGKRLDPPIPSSSTWRKFDRFTSAEKSRSRSR